MEAITIAFFLFMSWLATLTVPQHERYAKVNPPVEIWDGIPHQVAARDHPNGGYFVYGVGNTGSMLPTMDAGDYLIGIKVPYEELKEGDIVTYNPDWNGKKSVVHRLVLKDKRGWILSGDNNPRSESWERMTPEKYTSKVVKIIRKPKKEEKK